MPKVNSVEKCRVSPGSCGKCSVEINVGDPYRWIKSRFGPKKIRCAKVECAFRSSDLTSSDKLSRVYAARESAEDVAGNFDSSAEDASDVGDALKACAEEAREVAEEYRESAENIRGAFSESPKADECDEKADELESWADDLDSKADELPDKEDNEDADAWGEEVRDEALDVLGNCPV